MDADYPEPYPKSDPPPETSQRKQVACLSIDMGYVKSFHGILTAAITIISLLAIICVRSAYVSHDCYYSYYSAYDFFGFVAGSALLTGILHYIIYMLTFQERFKFVPWHIADLIWCGLWWFFYLIGSALIAGMSCGSAGMVAAAIFGFAAMVGMGIKCYHAYKNFRAELDRKRSAHGGPVQDYPGALTEVPPPYSP